MTGGEIMAGADRDVMSTKPEECVNYLAPFRAEPRNRSRDIRLWNWVSRHPTMVSHQPTENAPHTEEESTPGFGPT